MKRFTAQLASSLIGLFVLSATAHAACEPEKAAERYPSWADQTVMVATSPFYAPYNYIDPDDNSRLIGSDIELSEAALDCVGLKYDYLMGNWSSLLPTILNGRTDVMVANLYYTEERAQQVDFVVYMKAGAAMLVPKGNEHNIQSMDDLCGLATSVVVGSYSQGLIEDQSKKCVEDGKEEINFLVAPETDAAVRGLENDRIDFLLDNIGAAAVRVKDAPEKFEIAFTNIRDIFVGNAVKNNNEELLQAYFDGMKEVAESGKAAEIFEKYGLDTQLIVPVEIKR